MADWLKEGVVINARHMKAVPGRKSGCKGCGMASPAKPEKETLWTTLIVCVHAVKNRKCYFYAHFMKISAHHWAKRAYVAMTHSMLQPF